MSAHTSSPAFFEAKYAQDPDPWNFAGSPYELRRYDAILAALGDRRFHHAIEPGCSIGVLTERLAALCDRVDAFDVSASAVERARQRCAPLPNVHLDCAALSAHTPVASADLLILSEIGYYFSLDDWSRTASTLIAALPSGATVVAAHWLGHSPDHRLSGDQVHTVLDDLPNLDRQLQQRFEAAPQDHSLQSNSFRLDKWFCR